MTATATITTNLGTRPVRSIVDRMRRRGSAIRHMASALGAALRDDLAAGQLGPDPETVVGRATGARI